MAVESWLSENFDHRSAVCTSSADLEAMIAASLTAVGWSNPSANTYRSPGSSKWVQVVFSQPTSTKLEVALTEYGGRTATNRRVGTVTNPSTWKITATAYNFILWCAAGSTGFYFCGILSHFPKEQSSHDQDVYYAGYHNTSDTDYGANFSRLEMPSYLGTFSFDYYGLTRYPIGGFYAAVTAASGVKRDYSWMVSALVGPSALCRYAGRVHQALLVDEQIAANQEFVAPLDESTTGRFIVIGPASLFSAFKIAARVS